MTARIFPVGIALFLLAACAAIEGPLPRPGQSTAEVRALMGTPAERLDRAGGGSTWFYTRASGGRTTNAVRFSASGTVESVEQVLTEASLRGITAGSTSRRQVREILGPPVRITRQDRQRREVWEYEMYNDAQFDFDLYVQFSDDGIVREVLFMKDYHKEPDG